MRDAGGEKRAADRTGFPDFTLAGQTVAVTGATGGIGCAASLALARAGANMALFDVDDTKLTDLCSEIRAMGRRAISVTADVTRSEEVHQGVGVVVKEFGGIDVLFNNAGIGVRQTFLETSESDLDRVVAVNLKGAFVVAQAVARQMVRQGRGAIVNTASIAGLVGRNNVSAYAATKGGIASLTRVMAMELASFGVRVNSISPGMIYTPFTAAFLDADGGKRLRQIGSTIPLGRLGYPEDLVGAILYLASPASAYVTGQTIVIDGGWTAGVFTSDEGWITA